MTRLLRATRASTCLGQLLCLLAPPSLLRSYALRGSIAPKKLLGTSLLLLCSFFFSSSFYPSTSFLTVVEATEGYCNLSRTITFGQSTALSGPSRALGINLRAGIAAAFLEVNNTGGVRGMLLALEAKDDFYEPVPAVENAWYFANRTDTYFAMIGQVGTPTTAATLPIAQAAGLPFIGAFTGASLLRKPFTRLAVNFRASYVDETAAMVEYLINKRSISRIALMIQNDSFGEAGKEGVMLALESNNLYLHSEGRYTRNTNDTSAALAVIASVPANPEAIIMIGTYNPLAIFVVAAKKRWPDCIFLTVSFVGSNELAADLHRIGGETALDKVIVTQVVPLPTDTSIPVVARYQRALQAYDPTLMPNFVSLEGYLVGRMVIDALARIPHSNITRESFLDAIYDTGNFNFDGFRCGPFLPVERSGGCNTCMRSIMPTTILPNLTYVALKDQVKVEFESCGYKPKKWNFVSFAQTCPLTGEAAPLCKSLNAGVRASFKLLNDAGGLRGTKLEVVAMDDKDDPELAAVNARTAIESASFSALIGSAGTRTAESAFSVAAKAKFPYIGAPSGKMSLRKPFVRYAVNLRASLQDETAAIVDFLFSERRHTRISVFYETGSMGEAGLEAVQLALGGKRLEVHSQGSYDRSEDGAALPDIGIGLKSIAASSEAPEAIIVIGLARPLSRFVLEAKKVWPDMIFLALSSVGPELFASSLLAQGGSEAVQDVFVTSAVPLPSDTSVRIVAQYQAAMAGLNESIASSFYALEGFLLAEMLIVTLGRTKPGAEKGESLLETFYDTGSYNFGGLRCGPFEPEDASGGGCNQCMKTVWMAGIDSSGAFYPVTEGDFHFDTCGFEREENVDFALGGMRLGVLVVAALLMACTLALAALLTLYRKHKFIRQSFRFTLVTCLGGLFGLGITLAMYPIPTNSVCIVQPWVGHLSFVLIFGPLFAKTRRIAMLFNNKKLTRIIITDGQVMLFFCGIFSFFLLYLVLWTAIDPPQMVETYTADGRRYEQCSSSQDWAAWVIVGVEGVMLLWGCLLCYRVQGISGQYSRLNESKEIGLAIYNTSFLGSVLIFLLLMQPEPNTKFLQISIFTMLNTTVVLGVVFGRSLLMAMNLIETPKDSSNTRGSAAVGSELLSRAKVTVGGAPVAEESAAGSVTAASTGQPSQVIPVGHEQE